MAAVGSWSTNPPLSHVVSGLAIRDYRADIDLQPAFGGTTIRWRSSFLRPR